MQIGETAAGIGVYEDQGAPAVSGGAKGRGASRRQQHDPHYLRSCAWEIGSRRFHQTYRPTASYVRLATVTPTEGLATWSVSADWLEGLARQRGDDWAAARPMLRIYDVSFIEFNGLNAHRLLDLPFEGHAGERRFRLPHPGTVQLAEVGYLLRSGEFVPAARSSTICFPADTVSKNSEQASLFVDDRLTPEPVESPWHGDTFLWERRSLRPRQNLRVALSTFECLAAGDATLPATFVSELAGQLRALGLDTHLFFPASGRVCLERFGPGVHYHPLALDRNGDPSNPVEAAVGFVRALERELAEQPPFDLFHLNEWMTGLAPWIATRPTILAMTSTEGIRCNGRAGDALSREIGAIEREVARSVECLVVPHDIRAQAIDELGIDGARVHSFPIDGKTAQEWDRPVDRRRVKHELGLVPDGRLLLFVGPVEAVAGPDLLVDTTAAVLPHHPELQLAIVGTGSLVGPLGERVAQFSLGQAVRWLGHVEASRLGRLVRAADALVLPFRGRIAHDEDLVRLARLAGRPVITTHAGPAHLVGHDRDGLIVYSHHDSLVWGVRRLLEQPARASRMGEKGRLRPVGPADWPTVARYYAELATLVFPELGENAG